MSNAPKFHDGKTAYIAGTCTQLSEAVKQDEVTLKSFARGQYPGQPIPNNSLTGLRSVGYWSAVTDQSWGLDWHRNEGIEITFLLSGTNIYETSKRKWELDVGDVVVCPPWQIHRIGNPNISVGTLMWFIIDTQIRRSNQTPKLPSWIILSEEDKNKLIRFLHYNPSSVFHLPEKYIHTWNKLYRVLRGAKNECPVSALAITINELLLELLQIQNNNSKSEKPNKIEKSNNTNTESTSSKELPKSIEMVKTFLQELAEMPNQLEHPWTLKEMAKLCRISPTRFSYCCRQLTNLSPLNTLNKLRIKKAEESIRTYPKKTITEIAMECGFTTSQYFATVFKKWTGKTPTIYKNEYNKKNNNQQTQNPE
jgi:AraC family L-rhamnose operon regulatory protein RhaS